MKILQIIQQKQLRGAEIFACQLSVELKALGHHVDVVYLFDNPTSLLTYDLRLIALSASPKWRLIDIPAFRRLADIVRRGNYDIVQANAGDTLKYAVLSKLLFKWKAKVIFRNASLMSAFMRSSFHKIFNRWLLRNTNYIISVSENCRTDLNKFYPWTQKHSRTIPIGTYGFQEISPVVDQTSKHDPIFINISSFVPEKNHSFLINLFSEYYSKHRRGFLWLVGSGKLLKDLEKLTNNLQLTDRVKFWGYRKDSIAILKRADIFVMPSRIEGLPGAILEAMSCKVPVIAASIGGIPEVLRDGVNGFCMEQEDKDEYLKRMNILVDDHETRSRFADTAHQLINQYFLMPHIAKSFLKEYERLSAI